MKKLVKKIVKPVAKPLINRFNDVYNEINNCNIAIDINSKRIDENIKNIDINNKRIDDNIDILKKNNGMEIEDIKNSISKLGNDLNIKDELQKDLIDCLNNRITKLENTVSPKPFPDVENIFYYHGGSGNHGCEALVRTLCNINDFHSEKNLLYSYRYKEDYEFGLDSIIRNIVPSNLDCEELNSFYNNKAIALSIGGDNYCGYPENTKKLAKYNEMFNQKGVKTALIGCSIEPEVLDHQEVLDDLEQFSLITARESITYNALLEHGIIKNTRLIPDSAFTLESIELSLPENFILGRTVGINLSNVVQGYDSNIYDNYINLIQYIIDKTDYNIALIPHVIQSFNDDLELTNRLFREFCDTNRICMIPNRNCMELKGFIKRCEMFIGARTHSTIAAYSSCVPTLVVGYSVKSKGIAKDLFGSYDNYVISVHDLKSNHDLVDGFKWLNKNKNSIKKHLEDIMPDYISKCYDVKKYILELKEKDIIPKKLADRSKCTGCGACANICPKHCIKMVQDDQGFKYPQIDYTKCSRCNLCKNICPVLKDNIPLKPFTVYGAYVKNELVRKSSSSGGLFFEFAKAVLKSGGICVGAALKDYKVEHIIVEKMKDLEKIKRSKYVQSDINDIYIRVKKYLDEDITVLFTGTPCQVAGLNAYLNKNYINLICIDIVCHGVPSPLIYSSYLKALEKENNCKVTDVNFRSKTNGWNPFSIDVYSKKKKIINEGIYNNVYMKAFLQNLILRHSCYDCSFKNYKTCSDITLGDFWGVETLFPEDKNFLDNKGVSVALINSIKGKKLFDKIKDNIYYKDANTDDVAKYNTAITTSVIKSKKYDEFWQNVDYDNIIELLDEYTKE